ncbi:MAG: metallophosphoesterase [Clostridia bacterium]|nr:metallophosphoesterase [Clostridia bacterium]
MKIYAISDLHLSTNSNKPMDVFGGAWENYLEEISTDWKSKVTADDIVLIAGDISWAMKLSDAVADLDWIANLPGKKIFIRGNHDYWWKSPSSIRSLLKENMFLVQNDSLKLDNYIFCGTRGWTTPENEKGQSEDDKKIYNREVLRLEMSLESAKAKQENNEPIIALVHYPPFNSKAEDNPLTALFEKYGVKSVIYGHLHGKDAKCTLKLVKNGVTYYLTSCDQINNTLVEIE